MSIPNLITLGRIISVPLVVWLIIAGKFQLAFLVFLCAGLSDALDGYLAKRFDWRTELGAYLDPIADKALLVSIFVTLGYFLLLPVWLVIAVVTRDVLIVGAMVLSWMLGRPMSVQPLFVSKANTTAQILLAGCVLAELGFAVGLEPTANALIWIVALLTTVSAAVYVVNWVRHMSADAPLPSRESRSPLHAARRAEGHERP
jgi:cardiolipin synthase